MEKLNPFMKALTVLICGLIMSFTYSVILNGFMFVLCIILLVFFSKAKISSIVKIMMPALLAAISLFFTGLWFTNTSAVESQEIISEAVNFGVASYSVASLNNAVQLSTRILAFAALGILFALSTDSDEFIQSLIHQGKLPPKYAYGVSASFHLLPKIKEEYAKTKLAFKVRGINVTPLSIKPVFVMLVNVIHWSESIAMAMESKGFDESGKRTYYKVTQVKWFDWVFMALMLAIVTMEKLI